MSAGTHHVRVHQDGERRRFFHKHKRLNNWKVGPLPRGRRVRLCQFVDSKWHLRGTAVRHDTEAQRSIWIREKSTMLCVARFIKRAQVSVWAPHSERLLNQFQAPGVQASVLAISHHLSLSLSFNPFLSVYISETHTHIHVYAAHTLQDCPECWLSGRQEDEDASRHPTCADFYAFRNSVRQSLHSTPKGHLHFDPVSYFTWTSEEGLQLAISCKKILKNNQRIQPIEMCCNFRKTAYDLSVILTLWNICNKFDCPCLV